MRKAEVHVTTKNGQIKASPIESEIHPSHKTPFYALCISLLRRAVTFENPHLLNASFLRRRWLFRIRFAFRPQSLPGNGYGKPTRGLPPFARTISRPASMILRKARPLSQPGNGRMLVTAPLRSHSRGKPLQQHEIPTEKTASHVDVSGRQRPRKQGLPDSENGQAGGIL